MHIVYVTGNHEFFGATISKVEANLKLAFDGHPKIHYLEKTTFELDGVLFLGTTLWTGFNAYNYFLQSRSEENAQFGVYDFKVIKQDNGLFQTYHCKQKYHENCAWMRSTLQEADSKITIAVTHFPPSPDLSHGRIAIDTLSNYFQTDCYGMLLSHHPDYWIYGHNHWSDEKEIGTTTFMSNQPGYPGEFCNTDSILKYFRVGADKLAK
jgi:predicted phosphohydrolase